MTITLIAVVFFVTHFAAYYFGVRHGAAYVHKVLLEQMEAALKVKVSDLYPTDTKE